MSPGHRPPLADLPDDDLARRAATGERAALDVLLERHQLLVYRICRRLCSGEADALDATQEALITVARRIDRFDGRSAFTTWLYRVTTNACLDELRRQRRRPLTVDRAAGADDGAALDGTASDPGALAAQRIDLDRALARLAPASRAAVVLRDVVGLDYAEIAVALAVPTGTVKSRIARARAALARELVREDGNRGTAGERRTTDMTPPYRPITATAAEPSPSGVSEPSASGAALRRPSTPDPRPEPGP